MRYPVPVKPWTFWPLLAATLLIGRAMSGDLTTERASLGIISLELAGTESRARAIIGSWTPAQQAYALRGVWIDYLYLLAYSTTIGVACAWAAGVFRRYDAPRMTRWGVPLAYGLWTAALLDGIENGALLSMLMGEVRQPWPLIALVSALPKFILVILGIVYALAGVVIWVRHLLMRGPRAT